MTNSVFVNTQGLYQRRRAFNLSYRNDFTCNLGELVPVYWQDLIPNTSWSCRTHGLVRFMPMISPMMDNVSLYIHFWQGPRRILEGEEFTKMITGESEDWPGIYFIPFDILGALADLTGSDQEVMDYLTTDGSIFDMLGYSVKLFRGEVSGKLNARKFCMYFRLLSNWYTNENVEPYQGFKDDVAVFDSLDFLVDYASGNISALIAKIVYNFYDQFGTAGFACHMWPKDYFTSALPTLQFGAPTYLPLGESAPVTASIQKGGTNHIELISGSSLGLELGSNSVIGTAGSEEHLGVVVSSDQTRGVLETTEGAAINRVKGIVGNGTDAAVVGTVDLTEATAITINELRVANALQVFKEREMRFGRRAPEYYKGFYGVQPGDLRLQLPKFLGGGRIPIMISDIEQTSASEDGSTPQGNLAGKGTAIAASFSRASTFTAEEALVLGVAWLMPDVTYSDVLSRHDTKLNDRFDYYNPSFAHIGEQEVFLWEINPQYFNYNNVEFGYQPRYTEYRFHMNEMHGEFKNSLAYWSLGRIFDGVANFNSDFIYMQPSALQRVFAVRTTSSGFLFRNVLVSLKFSVAVLQPLSRYGTPGLMP